MRITKLAVIWWAVFEDTVRLLNPRRRYRDIMDNFVRPGTGGIRILEATVSTLDRFLNAMRTNHGNATVKLCETVLSGVLGLAARHGALDGTPLRDVATIPTNHKEVRALTVAGVGALRAGLRQWEANKKQAGRYPTVDIVDVVDIMLATGARIGEAPAIRWKDIYLKSFKPTVTVNATIVYMPGQGLTIQDDPKSARSRQRYFLPAFAVEMLLRRQIGQLEANPWDVVFPSAVGSLRDPNNFRKQWRSARDEPGFECVTPHTFRKTVGTCWKLPPAWPSRPPSSGTPAKTSRGSTTSKRPRGLLAENIKTKEPLTYVSAVQELFSGRATRT
ncbi:tyrosine-type recombinase/integrase [Arthrobacter sp. UYEF3]|uniref:tyrosine-type recombinase/integrase n=1 Tax=Arthrobacter sp. UYEF3 TaxID=1756365 RepID=UPI0033914321